jgi:hypothetical protein
LTDKLGIVPKFIHTDLLQRGKGRVTYHLKLQKGSAELAYLTSSAHDPNEEQQIEGTLNKFLRKMGATHLSPRRNTESSSPQENRHDEEPKSRRQGGARSVRIIRTSGPGAKKIASL